MRKSIVLILSMVAFIMTIQGALSAPGTNFTDGCHSGTWDSSGDFTVDLKIKNNCTEGNDYIQWTENLNLTQFGNVLDDEVIIGEDYMFVDTALRPDLDGNAELHFVNHGFAAEPNILVDGSACSSCNLTYRSDEIVVEVPGFSNYTLTHKQEFSLFSDEKPELDKKVYQTIDLGDAKRNSEFSCIVQIFGKSSEGDGWILVQTNPERKAVGNVLGDPDTNQPESLGYFPTKNGVANVYFRGGIFDKIAGYHSFQYVARCSDNQTSLVYEEPIDTRYSPLGRKAQARGVWLTSGDNAFYFVIYIIGGIVLLWIGGAVWQSVKF